MTFDSIAETMTARGTPMTPETAQKLHANALRKLREVLEPPDCQRGAAVHRRNRKRNKVVA